MLTTHTAMTSRRKHVNFRFRQANLIIELILRCIAMYFVTLVSSTTNSLPLTDIIFPSGTNVGDRIVPVDDGGFSPAINIPGGYPFYTNCRNTAYVSYLQ